MLKAVMLSIPKAVCGRFVKNYYTSFNFPIAVDSSLLKLLHVVFSSEFRNWWLVAHLTDLLHHRGILEPQVHRYDHMICIITVSVHSFWYLRTTGSLVYLRDVHNCYSDALIRSS